MNDFPRLILDANIMVSALLGKSFPLLLTMFEGGVRLIAPVHQIAETRTILVKRSSASNDWIDSRMRDLLAIVEPIHPALLDKHEDKARSRLHARGQPDWPVLAAAYETAGAVWSHDKDFFGSGAPVWSTKIIRKQLERVG